MNQLNEWLANTTTREGVSSTVKYPTADDVLKEWRPYGVVKTEVAPNNSWNYGKRSESRIINFIVYGRVSTFNLFGTGVSAGDKLYLVVRKEVVFVKVKGAEQPEHTWVITPLSLQKRSPKVEDLLHYASSWQSTTDEALKRESSFDDIGTAVFLGTAAESLEDGSRPAPNTFNSTLCVLKTRAYLNILLGM